jgi:peptidoglycan/xylan/chitin deacetylase (PgdA/CDA1 family)
MKISLTFDNGPTVGTTPFVLDTLLRANVRATFFQVGKSLQIPQARDILQRILSEGHAIANHSLTHTVPLGLCDADTALREIAENAALLASLGAPTKVFRPFGGGGKLNQELLHPAALAYLKDHAMTCITWNCVPRDWVDPDLWCDRALADIQTRDWSVVVIHDLPGRGMEQHLERFLSEAKALGADFRLDFPDDCAPVRDGVPQWDLSHLVAADSSFQQPAASAASH